METGKVILKRGDGKRRTSKILKKRSNTQGGKKIKERRARRERNGSCVGKFCLGNSSEGPQVDGNRRRKRKGAGEEEGDEKVAAWDFLL